MFADSARGRVLGALATISIAIFVPGLALAQVSSTTSSVPPMDVYDSTQVENLVRIAFVDEPRMIAAAKCESGFRQYSADGSVLHGGAGGGMIGVFQIHSLHKAEAAAMNMDITTLPGNLAYARYLYNESGMTPWVSSSGCWRQASATVSAIAAQESSTPIATIAIPAKIRTPLKLGVVGSDVRKLQQLLNAAGFLVAATGPGSSGAETTKFGAATRLAVQKFQCTKGITCTGSESTTGYGLVGPRTLSLLQQSSLSLR